LKESELIVALCVVSAVITQVTKINVYWQSRAPLGPVYTVYEHKYMKD
jgi:hypothetical protein